MCHTAVSYSFTLYVCIIYCVKSMMLYQIYISSALQLQSITKSITSAEAPVKEKYGRNIILGTHKEGGAVTFWSHAVSLPLSSNAILSWKFCHVVHKLLRDGHPNTLRDSRGHTASIRQMGTLWGNLHDRYGHIVALYAKLLCIKIDFHLKVSLIGTYYITQYIYICVFDMTSEVLEYMEAALKLQETVFRQMESSSTSSTTPVGKCRLAPLVLVVQDCGPLYHFLVKLLFKLHSRIPLDALLGHRERFREQFNSLTQFFERARGMEFFKSIIQIPDLPDEPPNFLRAASFADYVKPVVVQNETFPDFDETDTQLDFGEGNYQMVNTSWIGQTFVYENLLLSCFLGRAQTAQIHFSRLKEKHAELVSKHADLMRKVKTILLLSHILLTNSGWNVLVLLLCVFSVQLSQDSGVLLQKLQDEQFSLLQCAVVEAEGMVLDAVAKVDDPLHVRCICTPDYLINRAELTLASIDKMQQSHVVYLRNMDDASGLLRSVTQFSHLISDTIVNGAATAHSAPTDQADRLTDNCRDCATHCLQYLKELKLKATLPRADPTAVRFVVQRILNQGQDLRPRGADVQKEELADMVDKEMTATSTAIEDAVLRMDEILSQARRDSSGVKLEVNQSHFSSLLDIVESGRGAGSVKDFYAKNSCWTEGLISASKAVGWGATQMLESADKVVTDRGKYEELIVCSHEIAASTAQLVAASKVKADRGNRKLQTLQQASRHVNDMAAVVVSSTKSGQMQIENKNSMDFSSMSLIKLKTEEMDSQVKVLELEKQLANERIRLGGLRKKHYEIEGISTDSPPETPSIDGW
uniref:Huntingtin interacting protein 1 related n=1 Tax=Cyprinus carpio TaxID=7962 RepID=A0A8C1LI13_CYPCA